MQMTGLLRISGNPDFAANILCVDQFSYLGAAQRNLLEMLPALAERGWRPSVAIPGEGDFPAAIRRHGYSTHSFPCRSYTNRRKPISEVLKYALELPHLANSLAELVSARKFKLLYVNGPRLLPPAAWVAWRTGTPLVFHCHKRLVQHSAVALTGQALELASAHVIASCEYAVDPLREYIDPQRLRVIYDGVRGIPTLARRFPGKIRRIGVIGRVDEEKGQLEFVRAARLVLKQIPDCRFSLIGSPLAPGTEYYGQLIAASEGLPIEFIGCQEDLSKVYSDLDLLVVPSCASEASTRVILEAYSAEVPVVALPVGGIPEILHNDQTGFLAEAATVDALARRIVSVVRMNKATVWAAVKRARKEWYDRFTLRTYQENVCGVLEQAMQPSFRSYPDAVRNAAGALTN
jgi:glycosyltransferase involved in cell wall biosynthesis